MNYMKKIWEYHHDNVLTLTIGKVNYEKAHQPLPEHIHKNQVEIVLMLKGEQIYHVESSSYCIKSDEGFIAYANELHGTANTPEDKAKFIYIIFNPTLLVELGYFNTPKEKDYIMNFFAAKSCRTINNISSLAYLCDCMTKVIELSPHQVDAFKDTKLRNLLSEFIISFIELSTIKGTATSPEIQLVLSYIQEHIKEYIPLQDLADLYGISVSRFKTVFSRSVGIPPREYILREKIEVAKELLKSTHLSVTEIAFDLSFSSSQYFATVFKCYTYSKPSEYRMHHKKL